MKVINQYSVVPNFKRYSRCLASTLFFSGFPFRWKKDVSKRKPFDQVNANGRAFFEAKEFEVKN